MWCLSIFSAFYMVCTNINNTTNKKQILQKKHKKNKHADTKQKYYDTQDWPKRSSRLAQWTVTFYQKKILQTEFTNITVIFETVKVIKSMSNEWLYCETPLVKIVIFILISMRFSCDFRFTMIGNVYCLSYMCSILVRQLSWLLVVLIVFFMCFMCK